MKIILTIFVAMLTHVVAVAQYDDLMSPIPVESRVANYADQCTWASLETIGKWAGETRLNNLVSNPYAQGMGSPQQASRLLTRLGVKFKQSYGDKDKGIALIKQCMNDGRGCVFGVNRRYMMVLVHYDEAANRVNWIDNLDNNKIKVSTIDQFLRAWDSWVIAIYPSRDVFPDKLQDRKIQLWYYKPFKSDLVDGYNQ